MDFAPSKSIATDLDFDPTKNSEQGSGEDRRHHRADQLIAT